MSEVKVNKISPRSGTGVQLGDSGDTFTIPSGATILNSGTASGFGDNLEWQSSIVTAATITVVANRGYWLDTSSNAITVTLPGTAAVGDRLIFTDYARNWGTNAVTINQNSLKFQGNTSPNPVYDTNGESVDIVYSGTTKGWIPNNDGAVAMETQQTYACDFLCIAGGAGGGKNRSGGGGAGGYRNSFNSETSGGGGSSETALQLTPGVQYTVVVGGGGAGSSNNANSGTDGVDSSISGTGITTITSVGGGGGGAGDQPGADSNVGKDGGSGGGGAGSYTATPAFDGGSGTANQGFDGGHGNRTGSGQNTGGGGGGASAAGDAGSASQGGNGGNGLSSSIDGSATTRTGGGGGSGQDSYPGGTGGSGGGGDGNTNSTGVAGNGTVNTGSGGGAAHDATPAGNGGTGLVFLRVATSDYSGTTTGSPTVTTSGSDTIIKFTGSGTYTA